MSSNAKGVRYAEKDRETAETRVQVVLDLDGGTKQDIETGIGFLDHMLALLAFHAQVDLGVRAEGDLSVDDHHLVEDVAIVFGQAFREALRESEPVLRLADNVTPVDDALVQIAVDISGRGSLHYDVPFVRDKIGGLSTENVREFFRAFAYHGGVTAHVRKLDGDNDHHVCEALFKGFGRALQVATQVMDRRNNVQKGK